MSSLKKDLDSSAMQAINLVVKSKAQSKVYLFLLKHHSARGEEIVKGTHLHPSTVRESLSKMHSRGIIKRVKLKNELIGKNPFIYSAVSPSVLLQQYVGQLEEQWNSLIDRTLGSKISIQLVSKGGTKK